MSYAQFAASDSYISKQPAAHVEIVLLDESNVAEPVIGASTGINWGEDYEQNGVEEAGNEGIDEIPTGAHSMSGTLPAFYTPQWNDRLPSRQNFLSTIGGKSYTILERIPASRSSTGAPVVLNALVGCKISRYGSQQGARGLKTIDLAFRGTRRYNGEEWAALSGQS